MRLIHAACKRGVAAVVVTHDAQLASWADRVVFLRDGRVTDQTAPPAGPESLLARSRSMSTVMIKPRPPAAGTANGGVPARRAVIRWAWRLFRREWRQQLLVLALIVVAVGATVVGAAVAINTPPPANAGFGTAQDLATFSAPDPQLAAEIAALQRQVRPRRRDREPGPDRPRLDRELRPARPEPQTARSASRCCPCSAGTTRRRADQVALTPGLAADLGLKVGDVWHQGGQARTGDRHRAEPAEPAGRVRPRASPGQVTTPTAGHRAVRRRPGPALGPRAERPDASSPRPRPTRSTRRPSCWPWPPSACCSSPWCPWAASPCWPSAGCARSGCSAPWAPRTGTSAWSSGPTGSWWEWSARWSGSWWAWRPGWPTGPRPSRARTT